MEDAIEIIFKALCIIAIVFAVLSTNAGFLAWVEERGTTKRKKTSYQSYTMLCMVLLGWVVIYSGVIHLLVEQWEVVIPVSVFLMCITMGNLQKSSELHKYVE